MPTRPVPERTKAVVRWCLLLVRYACPEESKVDLDICAFNPLMKNRRKSSVRNFFMLIVLTGDSIFSSFFH
jgi:hypothetical protein